MHCDIVSSMATRIHKGRRPHYYIKEWIEFLGLTDDIVAQRAGVDRTTVWKWYTQQQRLGPDKVAQLAEALDRDHRELLHPPTVPSLDALAEGASDAERAAMIVDITRRMSKAG